LWTQPPCSKCYCCKAHLPVLHFFN
jgi:hypothetical protein